MPSTNLWLVDSDTHCPRTGSQAIRFLNSIRFCFGLLFVSVVGLLRLFRLPRLRLRGVGCGTGGTSLDSIFPDSILPGFVKFETVIR